MNTWRTFGIPYLAISGMMLVLSSSMVAQEQQRGRDQYLCSEPQPEKMCTAETTCGSSSTPCTVNIKRSGSDASATPDIPNAKANTPFCVKAGTTVTWQSSAKNTGFVLDFGPDSPFGPDAIMGGSSRPVSVVAKRKGCYKYSTGACVSGSIYGMCGSVETELIITSNE